jgi:hypothetical protein
MSEQKWVRSSLRHLSKRLADLGHRVSPPTVGKLLRQLGYSLRVNVKKHEGSSAHPDQNTQFEHIQARTGTISSRQLPDQKSGYQEEGTDRQL